jgi:hypothetical protein
MNQVLLHFDLFFFLLLIESELFEIFHPYLIYANVLLQFE